MSRRWRVIQLRGKGQLLGEVEAADEKAAEAAAATQFELNDEQRKRLAVQAMEWRSPPRSAALIRFG